MFLTLSIQFYGSTYGGTYTYGYMDIPTASTTAWPDQLFLGSYDRDPWSEQRCAHRRSDTILSDGGTNEKDG